jgi:hypothetical protein
VTTDFTRWTSTTQLTRSTLRDRLFQENMWVCV